MDSTTSFMMTPYECAKMYGKIDLLKWLINQGADPTKIVLQTKILSWPLKIQNPKIIEQKKN